MNVLTLFVFFILIYFHVITKKQVPSNVQGKATKRSEGEGGGIQQETDASLDSARQDKRLDVPSEELKEYPNTSNSSIY